MTHDAHRKKDFQVNRALSGLLTKLLLKTPLTPNHVTFLSLGFGLLSGLCFSTGSYALSLLGALSFIMAGVLDNCDGEIARAKNLKSVFGEWLDVAADLFTDFSFFAGLTLGLLKKGTPGPVVLFGILCLLGSLINFLVVVLEKVKGFGPAVFNKPNPEGAKRENLFFKITEALREGDSSWLVLLFALAGQLPALLWFAAFYMQIIWISAILLNFKWLLARPLPHENY